MDKPLILVVDDEEDIRTLLRIGLEARGFAVSEAGTVAEANRAMDRGHFSLCLTDMKLPDGSGLDVVKRIARRQPRVPVAVITAYGSVESAVEALKAGAFDFIAKPIDMKVLQVVVENAVRSSSRSGLTSLLVGDSRAMSALRQSVSAVAGNRAPVVLIGESGTGKSLVARELHRRGAGDDRPFVTVNCAALPEEYLLDAFFGGHEASAITGDPRGYLRAAQGGTLYLNDVASLPLFIQAKLLDVLQLRALPATDEYPPAVLDVRILSSSATGLQQAVADGRLRHDLFYRLNVIELKVPSLRERQEDLPALVKLLMQEIADRWGRAPLVVSEDALTRLRGYGFPGNVRELENILERSAALAGDEGVLGSHIEFPEVGLSSEARESAAQRPDTLPAKLEADERAAILAALEKTRWNRTAAANLLGMSFRQLRYRIKKFALDEDGL